MQRHGIKGTLRFTGEPAEKVRGSKPIHAAKGYYDGLAGMISFHPFYMLPLCNTARWDTHCGAAYAMIYRFICDEPEDWVRGRRRRADPAGAFGGARARRQRRADDDVHGLQGAARFHAAASGRLVDQRGDPDRRARRPPTICRRGWPRSST